MSYTLVDFEDLYTAICEEIKVPLTDGVTLARIKRDINMIYLNHVIPFKPRAWWWLEKKEDIQTLEKITTGTVTIADGSTTVTFSSAPAISVAGYYLKVSGNPDIIKISAHTAGVATATLETAWQNGAITTLAYTLWKDYASVSSTLKEITQVMHDRRSVPLDAVSGTRFSELRGRSPDYNGYPIIYNSGDFDSSGNRIIHWWPSCWDTIVTLHVEGRQEATSLTSDADEPLMPVEDRIVLFYGACSRAWARERNQNEATKNWNLFMMKLTEMAGKAGDAPQVTSLQVDPDYMVNKRYRRFNKGRRWESN